MLLVSLTSSLEDLWSVRRDGVVLSRGLSLRMAVRVAREVARAEHLRNGSGIRVEMHGAGEPIVLEVLESSRLAAKSAVPATMLAGV